MTSNTHSLPGLRVLALDDDPDILALIQPYLAEQGFHVETFTEPAEALAAVERAPYDLILSDVQMAGMSGFEFLQRVRAIRPELAIILMTAYEDEFPISQALAAGADGYLSKPFSLDKLSLLFDKAYWEALSRLDWWEKRAAAHQ